jgi:ureidoacrylate peracid hydrolase
MAPRYPDLAQWLDRRHSGLLVFGLQAGLASPEGQSAKAGLDVSMIQPAIQKQRQLVTWARGGNVPIIFARCMTRPETDSAAWNLRRQRLGLGPDVTNRELEGGGDFYPSRPASPGDNAVATNRYSAFHNTDLAERLASNGIHTLVVCGQTTDLYVDATVRDGFQRDYNMFVVEDACAAHDEARHKAALGALARDYCILIDSADIEAVWTG